MFGLSYRLIITVSLLESVGLLSSSTGVSCLMGITRTIRSLHNSAYSYNRNIYQHVGLFMVGALYSVVRPVPWYCGIPLFSHEIINVNTSKRALLFTNINEPPKMWESRYLSICFILMTNILTLVKYFNTTEMGSPVIQKAHLIQLLS